MKAKLNKEEPKPIHEQIIDAVGGEDRFREIAGLKPKQETLEEAAEKYASISFNKQDLYDGFIEGAKWKAERMYTYDELRQIAYNAYCKGQLDNPTEGVFNLWIQQFKKK
jgi:hypothetical protein